MRLVDLSNRRKHEEQMRSVLENEYVRIEAKDGRKIESVNCSIALTDLDHNTGLVCGTLASAGSRTVDCLVNLGTAFMTQYGDEVSARAAMLAAFETAMKAFDKMVAEVEKVEDDACDNTYKATVRGER